MSRRPALLALAVVAAASGCGGGSSSDHGLRITLDLKGGTNQTAGACGASHHFAVFAHGAAIRFSGDVRPMPVGRWKVKVKVKVCRGGAFRELTKIEAARDKRTGHFSGSIPAPPTGRYFARASLYENGVVKLRSDKRHYTVR